MDDDKYEALIDRLLELSKQYPSVKEAHEWLNDVGFTKPEGGERKIAILKAEGFLKEKLMEVGLGRSEAEELAKFTTRLCYQDDLEGHEAMDWGPGLH